MLKLNSFVKSKNSMYVLLFSVTYFVSYITRINYGAVLVEMVADTGFEKTALSVALTGSFITYGLGQIVSGIFGDRVQPKKLVFWALLVTSVINLALPFCPSPALMSALWSLNGFAQAFMWPPMVRLMVTYFCDEEYRKASVKVSFGSSMGTVAVFLISPLLISLWGWESVFWASAVAGVFMSAVWYALCPNIEVSVASKVAKSSPSAGRFRPDLLFLLLMLAIILQGTLRDGVTTWTPTYISESFSIGSEIAILTSVVLPIFSMLCHGMGGWIYYTVIKNPIISSGLFFGVGAVAALVLYLFGSCGVVLSVVALAVIVGTMHGVNLMLICMVPAFYSSTGKIAFVSGLLNSCTYVGSAISSYGIAYLTESGGWSSTVLIWSILAAAGALVCFALLPMWNKKMGRSI